MQAHPAFVSYDVHSEHGTTDLEGCLQIVCNSLMAPELRTQRPREVKALEIGRQAKTKPPHSAFISYPTLCAGKKTKPQTSVSLVSPRANPDI